MKRRGKTGKTQGPTNLERAWPHPPDRFASAESQDARGAPGSRDDAWHNDSSDRPESGAAARPTDASGVNPLGPIDPDMPYLKPGDQGG